MSAFIYKVDIYENGKWSNLDGCVQPLYDAETLDESLDYGKLKISMVRRKERIAIGTPVRIKVTENSMPRSGEVTDTEFILPKNIHVYSRFTNKSTYFYSMVANSTVIQRSFAMDNGRDLYDHLIDTIEFTKQLERDICDTLTFTNYLERDFSKGTGEYEPNYNTSALIEYIGGKFPATYPINTEIIIPTVESMIKYYKDTHLSEIKITYDGKIISPGKKINIAEGSHKLNYEIEYWVENGGEFTYEINIEFAGMPIIIQKPIYTITDVINRILEVGITRREGIQEQKYILDSKIAEKYKDVKAPEFHMTRSTLFEALLQVGGYIHAIPRLLWNEKDKKANIITFDELGGSDEFDLEYKDGYPSGSLVGYYSQQGMDDYFGTLDSYVDNIINTTDEAMGSVTEPFETPRCEEGEYEITNDTAIIKTDYPIYRLISLKILRMVNDSKTETYDLTPYVYEQAEYDTLTSYDGAYPYAKKYALKYVQGHANITGLSYCFKDTFNMSDTSLAYILKKLDFSISGFKDLIFQVSYIPIVSARIKQMKVYDDYPIDNALIYNQGANTVESNYYGEHIKGVIAKVGNEVETQTYYIYHFDKLPKCGQIFNGKYISKIEREFNFKYIKVTLTLTPNFNKLADYMGINSNFRLYDVSEKQSVDRAINYSDVVYIGNEIDSWTDAVAYSGESCKNVLINLLGVAYNQIARAKVQGFSTTGIPIASTCILPVLSFAQGNSIAFCFRYKDNFGAGRMAMDKGDEKKNWAQLVPYGDIYGELYYLKISLGKNESLPIRDITPLHNLPMTTNSEKLQDIDYFKYPLIVRKDSREALSVTLQLHFKANRKSIVIGRLLAQNNALVKNGHWENAIVFLPYNINMLNPYLDLTNAVYADVGLNSSDNSWDIVDGIVGGIKNGIAVSLIDFCSENKKARVNKITCPADNMKSWAIIDKNTREYYIGENINMNEGDTTNPIYFTFTA